MVNVGQILHDYIAEFLALIALIVWSIRLEGKVGAVEKIQEMQDKELTALDERLRTFDSKILSKLSEIAERLSFIEGSLRKGSDE
jgi:hypothetical protein